MPAFPKGNSTRRSLLARDVRVSLDRTVLGRDVLLFFLVPTPLPSLESPQLILLPSLLPSAWTNCWMLVSILEK